MSLPEAFLDELKQILPPDEIENFLASYEKPLKKSISICKAKIDPSRLIEITKPRGRHLVANPFTQPTKSTTSFYIDRDDTSIALGNTFLYQAGFFYIQELAASLPATQIESKPGDLILDMAAAPGGKTTQLAHRLNGGGLVIANEIVSLRLHTMEQNLQQMGCYNTAITQLNGARFGTHLPETFDHVLLDAPCSGEGTKFKSDDALTFWRKEEINKITGLQYQLLVSAIQTVKVGGTIVYSTCTLNPYENEEIIERALSEFQGVIELIATDFHGLSPAVNIADKQRSFDPKLISRCRPHRQGTGGFFVAKLRKIAKTNKPITPDSSRSATHRQFSFDFTTAGQKKATQRLKDTYGISLDPTRHLLLTSRDHISLCSPEVAKLQGVLPFQHIGIPILKTERDGYRPLHALGNIIGHLASINIITLDDEEIQTYSQGEDIFIGSFSKQGNLSHGQGGAGGGFQIVKRRDYGMSVTKLSRDVLKNKWRK